MEMDQKDRHGYIKYSLLLKERVLNVKFEKKSLKPIAIVDKSLLHQIPILYFGKFSKTVGCWKNVGSRFKTLIRKDCLIVIILPFKLEMMRLLINPRNRKLEIEP